MSLSLYHVECKTDHFPQYPVITANKPYRDMWITPQPSFARLPNIESRSSSSSPAVSRPPGGPRTPSSADFITPKTKPKNSRSRGGKGKGKESPSSSSGATNPTSDDNNHYHSQAPAPLPHEEDAGPSGFGTANEDYNTLTEEYLAAAQHTGYDGRVKSVENEGPLVEGSKAWEEAQEQNEDQDAVHTPDYVAVDGADEFRNPWEGK